MKAISIQPLVHALLLASLSTMLPTSAAAQDKKEGDPREFNYLQLAGGAALSSSATSTAGDMRGACRTNSAASA